MDIIAELDTYERMVREKQHEPAYQKLLELLKATSVHRQRKDKIFENLNREEIAYVATRLASSSFQFFLDDSFRLSEAGFGALSLFNRNFTLMLAMTPYRNADHVIRQLIGQDAGGGKKSAVDMQTFRKVLFLWSIYSDVEIPLLDYIRTYPELMKFVIFNALTLNCYVDSKVTHRRENLLNLLAEHGMKLELDEMSLIFAGPVWMYSAYPHTARKHEIKAIINGAYRRWLLSNGISEPILPAKRAIRKKPKIAIVIEQMTANHAVFRCYGKALESLREKFETVGVATKTHVDDAAMAIFDSTVYLEEDAVAGMKKNVGKVIKLKPDIIIYLSLGMQNNTIPLATLRLAPIQMFLMAHPCTSKIETIDYAIVTEGVAPTRPEFSERLVLVPNGTFPFTSRGNLTHEKAEKKLSDQDHDGKTIRIAIPSFAIKITGNFIDVLLKIREKSTRKVEFHFFPYLVGITYLQFKEAVEKRLPGSVVHLPYVYNKYLTVIGQCDFHMSPFPFGNTNGNIDSARMGLPIITMDGAGIESRIDVNMLHRMGMPDWTIAPDEQQYVELAVSLVEDDAKRHQLEHLVKHIDLENVFFSTGREHMFVDTVQALYVQHENIVASGERRLLAEILVAEKPVEENRVEPLPVPPCIEAPVYDAPVYVAVVNR